MKATTLLSLAAAATLAGGAAHADPNCQGSPGRGMAKLVVETTGVRSAKGEVATTVYPDDPNRFLARGGKLARIRTAALAPVTQSCFWLSPGTYAVAVYHDQNGNHEFDRTPLGLPAEGFGFSNDAPAKFGLPAFEAARFALPPGGRTIRIRLHYPGAAG
jgi:uncharacterized protein (DUF2141 family)